MFVGTHCDLGLLCVFIVVRLLFGGFHTGVMCGVEDARRNRESAVSLALLAALSYKSVISVSST